MIKHKAVATTVDNASHVDVAVKKLHIWKSGCFTHIFKLAAQKISKITTVSRWPSKISVTNSVSANFLFLHSDRASTNNF